MLSALASYPRGFSSRLAGDPTISPRVQKVWPRKSCRGLAWKKNEKKERKKKRPEANPEHKKWSGKRAHWVAFYQEMCCTANKVKEGIHVRWIRRASRRENGQASSLATTTEYNHVTERIKMKKKNPQGCYSQV